MPDKDTIEINLPQKVRLKVALDGVSSSLHSHLCADIHTYELGVLENWIKELEEEVRLLDEKRKEIRPEMDHQSLFTSASIAFLANYSMFVCIIKALEFCQFYKSEFSVYAQDKVIEEAVDSARNHLFKVIKDAYKNRPGQIFKN